MATIKEFIVNLDKKIKNIKTFTEPLRIAAFDVTAKMGERIFDNGLKTDNGKIGQYSTEPLYVNPNAIFKKTGLGVPRGKPSKTNPRGETVFKSGKKKGERHKTIYLAGGYKELRNKIGNRTDIVDLRFSRELSLDFGNDKTIAEPRKIDDLEYQIRLDKPINQDKRGGMEDKYGVIFTPSENEKEIFFTTIGREFRRRLSPK